MADDLPPLIEIPKAVADPRGQPADVLSQYTQAELAALRARGMIGPSGIPTVPPEAARLNSKGRLYSPDLDTMSPQERANQDASYRALQHQKNAGGSSLQAAAPAPDTGLSFSSAQPAPPAKSTGTAALPSEADALYERVRKAEGTAAGDGMVVYGGDPFKPGKEHPGDAARRKGPQGDTHAAGPGQWQPDTWNGLKPEFEKRFGRAPDFSSQDDQKAMVWLNAAKTYGGEDRLRADLAAGKLDTKKLASQWAGFGGRGDTDAPPVIAGGKWQVDDKGIAYEQGRSNTRVVWVPPGEYRDAVQQSDNSDKRKSLLKSLDAGDPIEAIPSLEVKVENGRLKIIDYDGANRAKVAMEEGVDLIPVAIHGMPAETSARKPGPAAGASEPAWIEDMNGVLRRFDYKPVAKMQQPAPPPEPAWYERFGTGMKDVAVGAGQFGAHAAPEPIEARAMPFAPPEIRATNDPEKIGRAVDQTVADREKQIQDERAARGETGTDWWRVAGNVAATAPLAALPGPSAAPGAGMVARAGMAAVRGALGGAEGAALAPVTSGDYGSEKLKQIGEGAALGGGVGAAGSSAVSSARGAANAAGRIVSPNIVTQAASRLFDENAKQLTPELLRRVKTGIQAKFERIEGAHDIRIDDVLYNELGDARTRAEDLLGETESKPIRDAIERINERALPDPAVRGVIGGDGIIPARSAATLWHKGSRLDNLTESRNPDIASLAQRVQTSIRSALNRQLSPEEAAEYSLARNQWRDLKIIEKALRPGETELDPRRFVSQVSRKFPEQASRPGGPEVLRLARAVGETWPAGGDHVRGSDFARAALGGIAGHMMFPGVGGALGAGLGFAGRMALEKLTGPMRVASPNAMQALRPPPPVAPPNNALSILRDLGQRFPTIGGVGLGSAVAAP